MNPEEKRRAITAYVDRRREQDGIRDEDLPDKHFPEPSCIAFGEGHNYVEFQLLRNRKSGGEWALLKDTGILEEAFSYVAMVSLRRVNGV